jgi:hypothetical protein
MKKDDYFTKVDPTWSPCNRIYSKNCNIGIWRTASPGKSATTTNSMPIKIACIKLKGCHEIAQGTYQLVGANTTKKRVERNLVSSRTWEIEVERRTRLKRWPQCTNLLIKHLGCKELLLTKDNSHSWTYPSSTGQPPRFEKTPIIFSFSSYLLNCHYNNIQVRLAG